MSGRKSRNKGKTGELELSKILSRMLGVNAHRSQQFCGANHDGDVSGVPGIHVECKRTESGTTTVYKWLDQAEADARLGDVPVVFHRKNNMPWLAVVDLSDLVELSRCVVDLVGMGDDKPLRKPK